MTAAERADNGGQRSLARPFVAGDFPVLHRNLAASGEFQLRGTTQNSWAALNAQIASNPSVLRRKQAAPCIHGYAAVLGGSGCNLRLAENNPHGKRLDGPEMGMRIVVVEDEVFIRLDLLTHLQAGGHEVVGTADSAADAVKTVESTRPDLVLMDMRLIGERDGIQAAIEIWERFAIRSLFVSANLDAGSRAKAASANPAGFLEKPFTRTSLLAAVATAAR